MESGLNGLDKDGFPIPDQALPPVLYLPYYETSQPSDSTNLPVVPSNPSQSTEIPEKSTEKGESSTRKESTPVETEKEKEPDVPNPSAEVGSEVQTEDQPADVPVEGPVNENSEDLDRIMDDVLAEREAAETISSLNKERGNEDNPVDVQMEDVRSSPQNPSEENPSDEDNVPLVHLRSRTRSGPKPPEQTPKAVAPDSKKKGKKPVVAAPKRKSADVGTSSRPPPRKRTRSTSVPDPVAEEPERFEAEDIPNPVASEGLTDKFITVDCKDFYSKVLVEKCFNLEQRFNHEGFTAFRDYLRVRKLDKWATTLSICQKKMVLELITNIFPNIGNPESPWHHTVYFRRSLILLCPQVINDFLGFTPDEDAGMILLDLHFRRSLIQLRLLRI